MALARAWPPGRVRLVLLIVLGLALLLCYAAARGLGDLRANTPGFVVAFGAAFALYVAAVALLLRPAAASDAHPRLTLAFIVLFAMVFRLVLLPTRPTLSDDMFRYVWDGRVQAHGLSPYRYPPNAPEVASLRQGDRAVWRYINRKDAVTVYPPGAQLAFAGLWRLLGDSVTGFKAALVLAELAGAALLLGLLRAMGQPPNRVVIYLWSPLLIFEVAHAGHVDGLLLPLLIGALWARVRERSLLAGVLLGAATAVKLVPALLLPALLPLVLPLTAQNWRAPARLLLGFVSVMALAYLPFAWGDASPLGFLPLYFDENFNMGLAALLFGVARRWALPPAAVANVVSLAGLALIAAWCVLRPAQSTRNMLGRCLWLMGWFTLANQNLHPWYLLWLLPLVTLFVQPGRWLGFKLTPALAWLVFTGTVSVAYLFFIRWRIVPAGQVAEFVPLYALLLLSAWPAVQARWRRAGLRQKTDLVAATNTKARRL